MAAWEHTISAKPKTNGVWLRVGYGGPRRRRPREQVVRREHDAWYPWYRNEQYGSHMPLDVDIHWQWHNPLNLLPLAVVLLLLLAVLAMMLG